MNKIIERSEFSKPGVYVLKSDPITEEYDERIYIGESEAIGKRLQQHLANAERDFKEVIAFISKDELLTKSHIKYIESRLVSLAKEAKSSFIDNANTPPESSLSEADFSDMEYFIEQIKIILPVAGYSFLIPSTVPRLPTAQKPSQVTTDIFALEAKKLKATLIETDQGFIVQKGSQAAKEDARSLNPGWKKQKLKLIKTGVLTDEGDALRFSQDAIFSSLSAAAAVVMGSQTSGLSVWKNKDGKSYKEIQETILKNEQESPS